MKSLKNLLTLIGVIVYAAFIPLAYKAGNTGFIPDVVFFMLLPVVFNWLYELMQLSPVTYSLLILGPVPHALGTFGWYAHSPLPIAWDHFTHLAGLFPLALAFLLCFSQWMDSEVFTKKNALIVASVFLLVAGIGAMIELSEFAGYLALGFGEGGFRFGPGDGFEGPAGADFTDAQAVTNIGGGWINTGWDLIYNTLAVLAGMLAGFVVLWRRRINLRVS